jgi:hypothetical protein
MSNEGPSHEVRFARDDCPYRWIDFVQYYGYDVAKIRWNDTVKRVSVSGTRYLPYVGLLTFDECVEHFRSTRACWPLSVALQQWETLSLSPPLRQQTDQRTELTDDADSACGWTMLSDISDRESHTGKDVINAAQLVEQQSKSAQSTWQHPVLAYQPQEATVCIDPGPVSRVSKVFLGLDDPERAVALNNLIFTVWASYTRDVLAPHSSLRWNNKGIPDYEDDENAETPSSAENFEEIAQDDPRASVFEISDNQHLDYHAGQGVRDAAQLVEQQSDSANNNRAASEQNAEANIREAAQHVEEESVPGPPARPGLRAAEDAIVPLNPAPQIMLTAETFTSMTPLPGVGGKMAWKKMQECRSHCFRHRLWELDLHESNEFPWRHVLRALPERTALAMIGPGIVTFKFRLLQGEPDHNYIKKDSGEKHVFEITTLDGFRWQLHFHKNGKQDFKTKKALHLKNYACHLTSLCTLCLLCLCALHMFGLLAGIICAA